jgi:hypothetical protein
MSVVVCAFDDLVAEAAAAEVTGWGFARLDGRATEERPPWGYARLVACSLARLALRWTWTLVVGRSWQGFQHCRRGWSLPTHSDPTCSWHSWPGTCLVRAECRSYALRPARLSPTCGSHGAAWSSRTSALSYGSSASAPGGSPTPPSRSKAARYSSSTRNSVRVNPSSHTRPGI